MSKVPVLTLAHTHICTTLAYIYMHAHTHGLPCAQAAAKKAITQVILSRIFMAMPAMG